jgi:protein transport protein HofC
MAELNIRPGRKVEELTSNLTKVIEPIILLIVGGLVGLLAVAVYLPIYQIGNSIK